MLILTNGAVVTPERVLTGHDLCVRDNRIHSIVPSGSIPAGPEDTVIDARGGYIAPGFIDIHSDYIEHMTAPRPTSMLDFSLGIHETERELVTHGITTMFHSLSIYRRALFDSKPIRNPENVAKFVDIIARSHARKHLIRNRFHARFELDNIERTEELTAYIREGKVHLVSFMDHTPGQGQYRSLEMYRKTLKGYQNLSEAELDEIVKASQAAPKVSLDTVRDIASLAIGKGIAIASHDDDSAEKLALVQGFGTSISEFPITMEVAREAKARGLHTVAGAPNVVLGGSHSGNLSAAEAIMDGSIDVLCSDYYPAALIHAVFIMQERHGLPLHEAFNLVTLNPARAVNMEAEIGSIEAGKLADLLIIEKLENDFPAVTGVVIDGKQVFAASYRV